MSIYKVVNNHYTEMLDYLKDMEKKYESIDSYFTFIANNPPEIKKLIDNLCNSTVSIEFAFSANKSYWTNKQKTQKFFFAMCIVFIVILFLAIIYFFKFKINELKLLNNGVAPMNQILLSGIIHFIVFLCISSIFIIMIVNIKGNIKLAKGQIDKLSKEATATINNNISVGYLQYMIKDVPDHDFYKLLLKLGYLKRNIKRIIDTPTTYNDINDSTTLYATFGNDIKTALTNFYDNGEGYLTIRKIYVLSNPINMLKESNRIMDYYKYIVIKQNNKTQSDEEIKKVLDNIVISQLKNIIDKSNNTTPKNDTDKQTIINNNINNKAFLGAYNNIIAAYLLMYSYLLSVYKSQPITDFNTLSTTMTIVINNISNESENIKKQLEIKLNTFFEDNFKNKYHTYFNNTSSNIIHFNNAIKDFNPLITGLYYDAFVHLQGNYWFILDENYIDTVLKPSFSIFNLTDTTNYINDYLNAINTNLIIPIRNTIDPMLFIRSFIIENISNGLITYNINLIKYQAYIVNKTLSNKNPSDEQIDQYNQLVIDIDKTLHLKKQLRKDKNKDQFIQPNEFISIVDDISYDDFITGLDVKYFQDIVNEFYNTISNSVNINENTLNNIYYNSYKNFSMWKVCIILVTAILGMILLYNLIKKLLDYVLITNDISLKKQEAMQKNIPSNIVYVNNNSSDRLLNWWFQFLTPTFVLIFIISLLFSFQKKSQAAFEFNTELIETNTAELNDLLSQLNDLMEDINIKSSSDDLSKKINLLTYISVQDKSDIFELMKKIIDRFDKCNYIVDASKSELPYPYTEMIMNIIMFVGIIVISFYIYAKMNPLKKLFEIKELNILKERALYIESSKFEQLEKEIDLLKSCHNDDIESIIYTLKLLFFVFIIMFLIFYTYNVISSTNDFKQGLYSSVYFDEQACYPQ